MRRTPLLALLAALFLLSPARAAYECPAAGEKAEDCPWAGAARLAAGGDIEKVLREHAPGLLVQMDADKANGRLLGLWGESINYDELAEGRIVDPALLSFIASRVGAKAPDGRIMHAGAEHTYGYLFSLLPTKFGFKRARWVRPDIEDGLGLPRGTAGPSPSSGTLLSNVTCIAGGIALRDDPRAFAALREAGASCAPAARRFLDFAARRVRLTEDVELPGGRTVSLRTDFVDFEKSSGGNSRLLIYSVRDSAAGPAYLVTAFPVSGEFEEKATAQSGLGAGKPVQTRYNAFVRGLTGAGKFRGRRAVSRPEK
ncbi:MAG: hypothetical protein M0025_10810 [Elusimicrobia bacterium]|nr:hypothetical protein [Elusimicrobiota bacterium]MDA8244593.1 hypothetical protein [Elusimicrobiota bacterium]